MSIPLPLRDPMLRFRLLVVAHGDCYRWNGLINDSGYGTFRVGEDNFLAHRFAYEMAVGPIPGGYEIDHLCRNRWCVRPSHLEAVTRQENCARADLGAHLRSKTHCPKGHPYSGQNLLVSGGRRCRICQRAQWHRWKKSKATAI